MFRINHSKNTLKSVSFSNFLLTRDRKIELFAFALLSGGLLILFYNAYPYPIINGDSGNYVLRAREMTIGAYRAFGYSVFLNWLHGISEDIRVVFFGQFILNFLSTVFFLLSIQFLLPLKRWLYYFLAFILIISPSIVYCTTLVMSDSLFYDLTLLYLASMLWLMRFRKWWILLVHLLILYFLLYVRYTALIYPFITAIGLLWGKFSFKKLGVAIVPLLVLGIFHHNVKASMNKQFGVEIFSGFSGWALANNAVSVIPYIDLEAEDIKNPRVRYVHSFVASKPDSIYDTKYIIGTSFMWKPEWPAKQMMQDYKKTVPTSYPKLWLYSSKLLSEYGQYLIKNYPWQYFNHFIVPNFLQLFQTFEIREWSTFNSLNLGYFEYPVEEYDYDTPLISILDPFRKVATSILWVASVISIVFLVINRNKIDPVEKRMLIFLLFFFLGHSFISVIAHPINNFRYLTPIYPVLLLFTLFSVNLMITNRNALNNRKA